MKVSFKCPVCNAPLVTESEYESVLCPVCGTRLFDRSEQGEKRRAEKISQLLNRASEAYKAGNIDAAIEFYKNVLELDPYNGFAKSSSKKLSSIITEPNLEIYYVSPFSATTLNTTINNALPARYAPSQGFRFTLPIGTHTVRLWISKAYARNVKITSRSTRVRIVFHYDNRGCSIEYITIKP